MIFDDHEVSDDWNISAAWVEEMRQKPNWNDQIIGGYASYWLYQHLGNLSPKVLDRDDLYKSIRDADDAWPVLRDFAYRASIAARMAPAGATTATSATRAS
jgi:AICAR transformylase/IMP cyclohydrolase PurH